VKPMQGALASMHSASLGYASRVTPGLGHARQAAGVPARSILTRTPCERLHAPRREGCPEQARALCAPPAASLAACRTPTFKTEIKMEANGGGHSNPREASPSQLYVASAQADRAAS
jgi:hypothetical protein